MKIITPMLLSLTFVSVLAQAGEGAKLNTDKNKHSYAFGFRMGSNIKDKVQDVDTRVFARGVEDAMSGTKPALADKEMQAAMQKYQEAAMKKQQEGRGKQEAWRGVSCRQQEEGRREG